MFPQAAAALGLDGRAAGAAAPAPARLRHCDTAGRDARSNASSGGSPRAARGAAACAGGAGGFATGSRRGGATCAASRLGGDECLSLDWTPHDSSSWGERFRTRAKEACGDTSAACYVRQRQAAAVGVDACTECTTKCCRWASAQLAWKRSGGDAAALDSAEAGFRATLQADPNNAAALASYAVFVHDERGDAEQASALFEEAASLAPADLDVLASWAYFAMTAWK